MISSSISSDGLPKIHRGIGQVELARGKSATLQRVEEPVQEMKLAVSPATENEINSLQNQLQDERECSYALKKENDKLKARNIRLDNSLSMERAALHKQREKAASKQEEMDSLLQQLNDTKVLLKKSENLCDILKQDQRRMRDVIHTLCGDLLGAHNGMEAARMETRHAQERCKEAEEKLTRERTDAICITNRIEELQKVHHEVTSMIDGTSRGEEYPSSSARRGKMLSMVRKLFSYVPTRKQHRNVGSHNAMSYSEYSSNDDEDIARDIPWGSPPHMPGKDGGECSGRENPDHFNNLRGGMESRRIWRFRKSECMRQQERTMREHVEEIHRLAMEDITALSDVIRRKNGVIGEMEDKVEEVRKKANSLEGELQKEREGRRWKKWVKDSQLSIIKTLERELVRRSGRGVSGCSRVRGNGIVAERGTFGRTTG